MVLTASAPQRISIGIPGASPLLRGSRNAGGRKNPSISKSRRFRRGGDFLWARGKLAGSATVANDPRVSDG